MNILYISNTDGALYNFRKELIERRITKGDLVTSITSDFSPEGSYIDLIKQLGVLTITTNFASKSVVQQILNLKTIVKTINSNNFDIVHTFAHQTNIMLFIALFFIKNKPKKVILTITGLGRFFSSNGFFTSLVRRFVLLIYRLNYHGIDTLFFLNQDDLKYFSRYIGDSKKMVHLFGEGLSEIDVKTLKKQVGTLTKSDKVICVFAARLMIQKGIVEYIRAAKNILNNFSNFEFVIAGSIDASISEKEILKLIKGYKNIHYIGFTKDAISLVNIADIIVLPSYYREGVPRILIESLMLGKYIITTDMPGCRDTILDGLNGKLVPIKDVDSIVEAILSADTIKLTEATKHSKQLFQDKFSSSSINEIIERYYE